MVLLFIENITISPRRIHPERGYAVHHGKEGGAEKQMNEYLKTVSHGTWNNLYPYFLSKSIYPFKY
jgi:hypothetical protein